MKKIVIFVLSVFLSGCALESEVAQISYSATPTTQLAPGNSGPVAVDVIDARAQKDRISSKTDAYGREMAPITSSEPVTDVVNKAVTDELHARGYRLGTGSVHIEIAVVYFYTRFEQGLFMGTADSNVVLRVTVANRERVTYSLTVHGSSAPDAPPQLHWANTAADALSAALKQALTSLVNDPAFRKAITSNDTSA